jgi:V/A-type H+-transporting ATPase subunit E
MILAAERGAQLIVEEILKEASDKSAQIIAAAKKEAKTLLDAARFRAKEEEDREAKEAHARGKMIYEEVLAEGRMRAKRETLQRKEELLSEVFKKAEDELRAYASSKDYKESVVNLAIAACKKLGSDEIVIRANKRDLGLLRKFENQIAKSVVHGGVVKISFGDPIQTIGGLRVSTRDGKMEIDDTFEGRLKREFDSLRVKVAKVLFEGSK